jgi:hypothetical protein
MAAPTLSELFSIGRDILSTTISLAKSTILAQTGDAITGEVEADDVEWYQHTGFWSRPAKATPGAPACQGVIIRGGGRDSCVASRDVRCNNIYGNLAPGETAVGASTGQNASAPQTWARTVYKADGSANTVTTDSAGNTMVSRLTPVEWRMFAPWGWQLHDSTGYHVRTWHGAKLDLGGLGLPAPFDIYKSSATLSADIVTIDAAVLSLGRDGGNSQPATLSTTLLAFIAQQSAALNALQIAVQAVATALTPATPVSGLAGVGATLGTTLASTMVPAVAPALVPPLLIQGKTSIG